MAGKRMKYWLHIFPIKNRPGFTPTPKKATFFKAGMKWDVWGFTLIEGLVVATIFSFIAVSIAASFISGMKLWNYAQQTGFSQNNLLLGLEAISSQLRQGIDIGEIGFEGDASEVSFPALIGKSIFRATYKFDLQNKTLLQRLTSFEDILASQDDKFSEKNILSADELSLNYLYFDSDKKEYIWKEAWDKDEGMFCGVKFSGKLKDEEFTRTILIPAAI